MTVFLGPEDVARHLSLDLSIEAMRRLFAFEGEGLAGPVSRTNMSHPSGWMRVLPGVIEGLGVFGHKVISFNRTGGVRYVINLFDIETGELSAIVDGRAISAARTAGTAAVAADALCASNVQVAAIIGTGVVAKSQIAAIQRVRPAGEIRVYSRDPNRRAAFIAEIAPSIDARLVDCDTADAAIEGATLISIATVAAEPLFLDHHFSDGIHVSSVGAAKTSVSEVAPELFGRFGRVVCDSVDLVFSQSGDGVAAVSDHGFDPATAQGLADIAGDAPAENPGATLFKSVGTGLQDLALAHALLEEVRSTGDAVTDVGEMISTKPPAR